MASIIAVLHHNKKDNEEKSSVGNPDQEDPHDFGPPGSGGPDPEVRIRILPFSHKGIERTEIILSI